MKYCIYKGQIFPYVESITHNGDPILLSMAEINFNICFWETENFSKRDYPDGKLDFKGYTYGLYVYKNTTTLLTPSKITSILYGIEF